MASERRSVIALITDLGTRDPTVSQFKAAVYAVNTNVEFVEITHEVKPHDLLEAAFLLERSYRDYPTRAIFVVLVEQLLGAPRRPLLAVSMDYYYFAPDNGVLSFVYQTDSVSNVYHITADHYIKTQPGPLAPHADVYGPAVGWLTKGIESANFGDPVQDFVKTQLPTASRPAPNAIQGMVLHVDRFGSLITNISENQVNAVRHELGAQVPVRVVLGDKSVPMAGAYVEGGPEILGMFGHGGYLQVISARGEAATALGVKRGQTINVAFG